MTLQNGAHHLISLVIEHEHRITGLARL